LELAVDLFGHLGESEFVVLFAAEVYSQAVELGGGVGGYLAEEMA